MRVRWQVWLLVAVGCGPNVAVDAPSDGTSDSTSSTSSATSSETTTSAGTTVDPSTTTRGESGAPGSTGDDLLVPAGDVITWASCLPDGTTRLFSEVYLDSLRSDCVPAPDIDPTSVLLVGLDGWDGLPGTFEVGEDKPGGAAYQYESLEGELTVEVWAPYHVSFLHLDLHGASVSFVGTLDVGPCFSATDEPCDAGGTTGTTGG